MSEPTFYVGIHQPSDAKNAELGPVFISVNRLRGRKKPFIVGRWIMDSGAFTEISTHGHYRHPVSEYAAEIRRWVGVGTLEAVVAQDWMCEPWIIRKTGLTVWQHQQLTIERYDALMAEALPVYVMPVLQGYLPRDYVDHIAMYGERLAPGAWVGVGSVCKRNARPESVLRVLEAIKAARPDLRLHGFGLKKTALLSPGVRELIHTADSMAWSFAARREGRNQNDWREAARFRADVDRAARMPFQPFQLPFRGLE